MENIQARRYGELEAFQGLTHNREFEHSVSGMCEDAMSFILCVETSGPCVSMRRWPTQSSVSMQQTWNLMDHLESCRERKIQGWSIVKLVGWNKEMDSYTVIDH